MEQSPWPLHIAPTGFGTPPDHDSCAAGQSRPNGNFDAWEIAVACLGPSEDRDIHLGLTLSIHQNNTKVF